MAATGRGKRILVGLVALVGLGAAVVGSVAAGRAGGRHAPVPSATGSASRGAEASALAPGPVRSPVVAGRFYPADSTALAKAVDGYLAQARDRALPRLRALVVPHAGYVFSGPTAGEGFRQLRGRTYHTVFVLAPSHHAAFRGVSVGDFVAYQTPLGRVPVAPPARTLSGVAPFTWRPEAEPQEHALEVELPFLQRVLSSFSLVPLVFGAVDPSRVAAALEPRIDPDTLVVASSDLSHYHPYDEAVAMDRETLAAVVALDVDGVGEDRACGRLPILTVMHLARRLRWRAELLDYRNSGDTAGNRNRVVGYAAIAFVDAR